jgi:hypothetical protein
MNSKKQVSLSPLQCFPSELLHMILKYSTNDFHCIIRFSAVCQQWKNVGDFTFLWLNCPLHFYCSQLYFETEIFYGSDLIQAGDRYFTKIRLDDPLPLVIPSNKFKIEVSRYRGSTGCLNQDSRIPGLKPFGEANRIRNDFMRIFAEYHRVWNWYGRWRPVLYRFDDRVSSFLDFYALFTFVAGTALTSLSSIFSAIFRIIRMEENYHLGTISDLAVYISLPYCISSSFPWKPYIPCVSKSNILGNTI